jgi:hypothetical protein
MPLYPLGRKLGWPQSQSGRHKKEKILDHTWTLNPCLFIAISKQICLDLKAKLLQKRNVYKIDLNSISWE